MVETGFVTAEKTKPTPVLWGPRRRLFTLAWPAGYQPGPQTPVQQGQSRSGRGADSEPETTPHTPSLPFMGPVMFMGLPRTDRLLQPGLPI